MNKLYIVCGIPFSGKTTLSKGIAKEKGFERIDLDDVKFELYGSGISDKQLQQKDWDKIYVEMYLRIEKGLSAGKTIIHDAGNFTKHERGLVRQIADKLGINTNTIFVDTPVSAAYGRLIENKRKKKRFNVNDRDFKSTASEMEPPTQDEHPLIFHSDDKVESWIEEFLL